MTESAQSLQTKEVGKSSDPALVTDPPASVKVDAPSEGEEKGDEEEETGDEEEETGNEEEETGDEEEGTGGEEEETGDEEEDGEGEEEDRDLYPYGKNYQEITEDTLKEIGLKIGRIGIYWPEQLVSVDELYPESYYRHSNKEKILLWYAENFRRQYQYKYKERKPLVLALDNECGIQKMVCTTIRPTSAHFPEFGAWDGVAKFVADYLQYEPLEDPTSLPRYLHSPHTVLERQRGHSFEYSTVLCSFLIGSGYNAFVVSGYADREFCLNDQSRKICPYIETEKIITEKKEDGEIPKYQMKEPPLLQSQFLIDMELKEKAKKEEEENQAREKERQHIEEIERPPPDELYGFRLHSWVLVLPPNKDVTEPFFIEPSCGDRYELDSKHYLGIESIWNPINYWVNMQSCDEGCENLKFDLKDIDCWEHLLIGEPWDFREFSDTVEDDSIDHILAEKHLDMPASWVKPLTISNTQYEQRYPGGHKTVLYKKVKLDLYAPFANSDGLVTAVSHYADYEWQQLEFVFEYYKYRADYLFKRKKTLATGEITEYFLIGRDDALKEHTHYAGRCGPEDKFIMCFYENARTDGLEKLEMDPICMKQHFKSRYDHLYFRKLDYEPRKPGKDEGLKRNVQMFREEYDRNLDKQPEDDVATKIFAINDNYIALKYHYGVNRISQKTREFIKPPIQERGDRLKFDPDLTSGYEPDPLAIPPKKVNLYCLLRNLLEEEEVALHSIRELEDELAHMLNKRYMELTKPELVASVFNISRNQEALQKMREDAEKKRLQAIREVETEVDYLQPYLAQIGNPEHLATDQALQIRDTCLADYKQYLVDKQNELQNNFEKLRLELQERTTWYEQNQEQMKKSEEDAFFEYREHTQFILHIFELRLKRFKEIAPTKYLTMESHLRRDRRLGSIYW